jgi:hypothetical protein
MMLTMLRCSLQQTPPHDAVRECGILPHVPAVVFCSCACDDGDEGSVLTTSALRVVVVPNTVGVSEDVASLHVS